MKEIKNVLSEYRSLIIKAALFTVGMAIVGTVLHDLIVTFIPDDEMTVFPLGTFMILFAVLALAVFVFVVDLMSHFNMAVAFGGSRKKIFLKSTIFCAMWYSITVVFAWLFNKFEMWKMQMLFHGQYELELDLTELFDIRIMVFLILFATAFTMLLTAFLLRFGRTAYWIVYGLYMATMVLATKMDDIFGVAMVKLAGLAGNYNALVIVAVVIIGAILFAAKKMMLKQQVTI